MNQQIISDYNQQIDKLFGGASRAYGALAVNYVEALVNKQLEAARDYADMGLKQFRGALEIRNPEDLQSYIQDQQQLSRNVGERLKDHVESLVALQRDFVSQAQNVTEKQAGQLTDTTRKTVRKAASSKAAS